MFQPRPFDPMTMLEVPQTFNNTLPIYIFIRRLIDLRKEFAILSRGMQIIRWSDANGPGLFIFSRIYEGQEAIIALNTATSAKTATIALLSSSDGSLLYQPGVEFMDVLDTVYITVTSPPLLSTTNGASLSITVPPRGKSGIRVLMKRDLVQDY
jgi:hypothetical protein